MSFVKIKSWLAGLLTLALVACGGGGGGGAGTPQIGGSSGTGTGTGGSTATATLSMSLSSTTVTAAAPAKVTATLASSTGAPLVGQVVSFTTSGGLGSFSSATALTDSSGQAVVTLSPAASTTTGADTVVASFETSTGTTVTAKTGFQLTATNVTISAFTADVTSLGAYGQTQLTVDLAGTTPTVPVTVTVSSACVTKARATLTPTTATVTTGKATFTYRDQGCGATDTLDGLQASVVGASASAQLQLALTSPVASSVAFQSATPTTIYLRGTGLVENSNVVFQLRDANGLGVPNRLLELALTTLAGGLLLDDTAAGPGGTTIKRRTDSDGKVTVRVNAGTVPTPVRVTATLLDTDGTTPTGIKTVSSSLAVAVGLPSQNNFSLAQKTHNIEGYNTDGTSNTYTIIASDRLSNPVPDGTAINFVAEGGQVQAIGFTATTNGLSSATVNFQTSNPRPVDGRVTVLAYALGEESFLDANGDNVYTAGEDYQGLGDVFLDRLFNGTYNPAEDQFISLGSSGTQTCNVASSSLLTIGTDVPSRTTGFNGATYSTCDAGWGRAYVRRATQTVFSTSAARPLYGRSLPSNAVAQGACPVDNTVTLINPIEAVGDVPGVSYRADDTANRTSLFTFGSVAIQNLGKTGTLAILVADANPVALNPMPAGTVISVVGTTGLSGSVIGSPVASSLAPTGAGINYTFADDTVDGTLTVSFRSPGGLITSVAQKLFKGAAGTGWVACP